VIAIATATRGVKVIEIGAANRAAARQRRSPSSQRLTHRRPPSDPILRDSPSGREIAIGTVIDRVIESGLTCPSRAARIVPNLPSDALAKG
jgi:hypothetical protein